MEADLGKAVSYNPMKIVIVCIMGTLGSKHLGVVTVELHNAVLP